MIVLMVALIIEVGDVVAFAPGGARFKTIPLRHLRFRSGKVCRDICRFLQATLGKATESKRQPVTSTSVASKCRLSDFCRSIVMTEWSVTLISKISDLNGSI